MKKYLLIIIVLLVAVLMVLTVPDKAKHKEAMMEAINEYVEEEAVDKLGDTVLARLGKGVIVKTVETALNSKLKIENYYLFNKTYVRLDGEDQMLSLGMFGHVFTFDKEMIREKLEEAMNAKEEAKSEKEAAKQSAKELKRLQKEQRKREKELAKEAKRKAKEAKKEAKRKAKEAKRKAKEAEKEAELRMATVFEKDGTIPLKKFLSVFRENFRPETNFLLKISLDDWVWLKSHLTDTTYFNTSSDRQKIEYLLPRIKGVREDIDPGVVVNFIKSIYALYQNRETLFEESLETNVDLIFDSIYRYLKA